MYNAIENLDDHVLRYDLEGLEKTLRREVFGQQGAVEGLLSHLKDYLSTYVHNKPLVVSLHGPSGVGKSHLGRLLAGHFRSVVGETLVLQYYVLHHCPQEADALQCARNLSTIISEMVERAEEEEKIPLFIFDEAEHMHSEILDALWQLVASKQSNEYLNAIYLFLSNLGHAHITKHMLHNSSSISMAMSASGRHSNLVKELTPILRNILEKLHLLWTEADILPLGLLEKSHVMECFLDEMTREGFYPDHSNIERLAGEIQYYPAVGGHEYSQTGCKQVVAKVNLLWNPLQEMFGCFAFSKPWRNSAPDVGETVCLWNLNGTTQSQSFQEQVPTDRKKKKERSEFREKGQWRRSALLGVTVLILWRGLKTPSPQTFLRGSGQFMKNLSSGIQPSR